MLQEIYSYHNFMFPFRFDKIVQDNFKDRHRFYRDNRFESRVNIEEEVKKSLKKDDWEYQKFEVKNNLDYNELVYFYDFVKDSLFNTQEFEKNATSYYFEKQNISNKYTLKTKENTYNLKLTGITLRLFDTGVGILSFEIENYDYKELKDILKINEFGRRVYPQFLGDNFSVDSTKEAFLADYIELNGIKDDFKEEYKNIKLANFILKTLGDSFTSDMTQKDKLLIQPLLDDRMFVLCWYGDDNFANNIKDYKKDDNWYKFVFVDNNKMIQNEEMQNNLIVKSTYSRWQDYNTLYGLTRYSFMLSTLSFSTLKENHAEFIVSHTKTMYFQMIILLLAQRASILRFSDEVTAISDIEPEDKRLTDNISNLYKHYLRFKNKLYFKEITPQEQGIELYDKAREIMRIDSDITDLSNEIQSLNGYAYLIQEREEKEQMNKLTKLGIIFLPGTFIAGVFGMNIFPDHFIDNISGFVLAFGSIVGLTYYLTKINNISIKDFFTKEKNE